MTGVWSFEDAQLRELLKNIRIEAQLTQKELATRLDKPQSYVSKYESGERRLDIIEIRSICLILGISLSTFGERFEELLKKSKNNYFSL